MNPIIRPAASLRIRRRPAARVSHWGVATVRLPDRGRRRRGRPDTVHLGHLLPGAGRRAQRRQRRRGLRPLPPDAAGRRADQEPRRGRVPVLGGLAAGAARRPRPGQPGRPRLLRPARRRAAGQRHRPLGDAVPLGPAAGAGGRRRLAEPGHRLPVRRLRHAGLRQAPGPGGHVHHAERAVVLGVARLPRRRARARPARLRRRPATRCTTCCSATASRPSGCGPRRPGRTRTASR